MNDQNPVQTPPCDGRELRSDETKIVLSRLYEASIAVFLFNMIVPLYFALEDVPDAGRVGIMAAAMLWLASGFLISAVDRKNFAFFIAGAMMIGLTQMLPILQILAGLIGEMLATLVRIQLISFETTVRNEVNGFITTLVTRGILIAASGVCGLFFRRIWPLMKPTVPANFERRALD